MERNKLYRFSPRSWGSLLDSRTFRFSSFRFPIIENLLMTFFTYAYEPSKVPKPAIRLIWWRVTTMAARLVWTKIDGNKIFQVTWWILGVKLFIWFTKTDFLPSETPPISVGGHVGDWLRPFHFTFKSQNFTFHWRRMRKFSSQPASAFSSGEKLSLNFQGSQGNKILQVGEFIARIRSSIVPAPAPLPGWILGNKRNQSTICTEFKLN